MKDEGLARLAAQGNVAQFVSFTAGADPAPRFSRLRGLSDDTPFDSVESATAALLSRSPAALINVRSYAPDDAQSREFLYGLATADDAAAHVRRLARDGLYTIVNETIDIHDGGVSGVAIDDVVEFAPDDTPRCVERPGTTALPRRDGLRLLGTVYGVPVELPPEPGQRVEFSVHPLPAGVREGHTVLWEVQPFEGRQPAPPLRWPNHFSRLVGDKAFGLLVADLAGLPVPRTTVVGRRLAPFDFGLPTGSGERWLRTCPAEQDPGRFTTRRGWLDPFVLLAEEDPKATAISSVLAQHGVRARWSGATLPSSAGEVVEGVRGSGDRFMQGVQAPDELPADVTRDVRLLVKQAQATFGSVRVEWVHDGERAWVVQLHVVTGAESESALVFVAGSPETWLPYAPEQGLDVLRALIVRARAQQAGIVVTGPVGVTSHVGDVLRRSGVPARVRVPE